MIDNRIPYIINSEVGKEEWYNQNTLYFVVTLLWHEVQSIYIQCVYTIIFLQFNYQIFELNIIHKQKIFSNSIWRFKRQNSITHVHIAL